MKCVLKCFIVCLACCPIALRPADTVVRVVGRVLDQNDSSVFGADVSFISASGYKASTISDSRGRFELTVRPGAYVVSVCSNTTKCFPSRTLTVKEAGVIEAIIRPIWQDPDVPEPPLQRKIQCPKRLRDGSQVEIFMRARFIRQVEDRVLFGGPEAAISNGQLVAYADQGVLEFRSCRVGLFGSVLIDKSAHTSRSHGVWIDFSEPDQK